ncbi:MAG TPA: diphthine--ammonia ligase [Bacteroidota bacterium]
MAKQAFCLYSGGKDSHLALKHALDAGYEVALLLTFFDARTRYSLSHRLPARMLRDQARLMGLYLQEVYVSRDEYEPRLRSIMQSLALHDSEQPEAARRQRVDHAIFGDIYLEDHKSWNERLCAECGVTPVFPLWGKSVESVFEEQRSFRSLIVSVEPEKIERRWLGKPVNDQFRQTLATKGLDICGEKGEYHTFVTQSPLMKGRVQVEKWKEQSYDSYVGLDIQEWSVVQEDVQLHFSPP